MSLYGRDSRDLAKARMKTNPNDKPTPLESSMWLASASGVCDVEAAYSISSTEAATARSQTDITELQTLSAVQRADKPEIRTGSYTVMTPGV